MTQAVFPVDIKGISERDALDEATNGSEGEGTRRSRAIYALPAASFLTAGCDLNPLDGQASAATLTPPAMNGIGQLPPANPVTPPTVDVISVSPPTVPVTPPTVNVTTPVPANPVTSTPTSPAPVTPAPSSSSNVAVPPPTVTVPVPAVDVTAIPAVLSPLVPALNPTSLLPSNPPPSNELPAASGRPATATEAAQFILKASLSVNEQEIADLQSTSYGEWLVKQLNMPIQEKGQQWMDARKYNSVTADEYFYQKALSDFMVWHQMMNSPDAVRKKIAFALSEFFVVSSTGMDIHWTSNAMTYYWDLLNHHAFGNFRELLEAITLCPVMGVYLSMLGNKKEDEATGRVPDENFAREIMQLFTIGLYKLNNDGTLWLEGGKPVETYTNDDITNLARVFTGYNYDFTDNGKTPMVRTPPFVPPVLFNNVDYVYKPMTSEPQNWEKKQAKSEHSLKEKRFLKTVIPENTGATKSLGDALDALFNHPNVGPFFCKQMIQRLITSNPSPAYVNRVASVFNRNSSGARGDLRAVFKAILLDVEAISPSNAGTPTAGKLREPALRLTQWGRTFGATSLSGRWAIPPLMDPATSLSQSPLRAPSVFNFFRPGYVPPNTQIATNGFVAPEFQLVSEVSIAGYVNFMASAIRGQMTDTSFDVTAPYKNELAIAHNSEALLDRLCLLLAANQISARTKTIIKDALDSSTVVATSHDNTKLKRIHMAILLVMASPDYLVQK